MDPDHSLRTYNKLLKDLADHLTTDNVRDLRFLCALPAGESEQVHDGLQFFKALESSGKLTVENLDILCELLDMVYRKDLTRKVKDFVFQQRKSHMQISSKHSGTGKTSMAHVSQIPVMYEKTNQKGTTRIVRSMSGGVSLLPPSHFTKQTTTKGEAKEGNEDENCEKITFSLGSKLNVSLKNSQFHSESKVSKSFSESKGMTKEVNNKLQIAKETAKETVNESYKSVTPTHKVMSKPSENIKSENESVLYEPASGNNVSKDKLKATITTIQQMPIDNPSTPENDPRFSQLPPNLSNQLSKIQSRLAGQNIDPLSSRESLRSIYGLNLQGLSVNNTARPSMHFACPPSLIEPPELNLPKYKMTKKPRGLCVVISNKDFSKGRASCPGLKDGLKDRRGTDVDADNLKSIFEWFEFKVEVHKDKEGHAMWTTLLNYTKVDHSDYDCFVCCILTHGCFNGLHGVDGKVLKVQQALMLFNGTACPSLANKPKLFFLQACRGTSTDLGYKKDSSSTEESDEIFSDVVNLSSDPSESDYFVGYATPPGYLSWRSTVHGSWYISKLCEVFRKYGDRHHLLELITKVNEEVSKAFTKDGYKQIPNPSYTLRKLVYFLPRPSPTFHSL